MKKGVFRFPMIKVEGGSSPDPAVYCPAAGYIPDPEILHPPIPLPETTPESITCICNASVSHWRCLTNGFNFTKSGAGLYQYKIYDNTATLIDSFTTSANAIDFDFPTASGYYTVEVSLSSPNYFTAFYRSLETTILHDSCIEAIIFNCPNLTGFNQRGNNNISNVSFASGTLGAINGLYLALASCKKINYFNPGYENLSTVQRLDEAFKDSSLLRLDISELNSPGLTYSNGMVQGCKYITEVIMPSVWYSNRNYGMFRDTPRMVKIVLPITWSPSGTPSSDLTYLFYNCGVEHEIELPSMSYIKNVGNMFYKCYNVPIIRLKGNWTGLTQSSFSNFITDCASLKILEMPRITSITSTAVTIFSTIHTALKNYIGPDVGFVNFPTANSPLESITGEHDTSAFSVLPTAVIIPTGALVRANLSTLQCSKLRVQRFVCGTSAATKFTVLNSLEIDWTNSSWASTISPQLSVSAAINATEINRILTALPTVTGKTADFRYCDGYATCDKTIATAKGWTML